MTRVRAAMFDSNQNRIRFGLGFALAAGSEWCDVVMDGVVTTDWLPHRYLTLIVGPWAWTFAWRA